MHKVLQGDAKEMLKTLPDNSIDSCVTDPPYELGFMGKKWDKSGITFDVGMWRECYRVLKPGGYLLSFGGCRTYHRIAVAIEDAGFIIHPMIAWVFGSGFPKATNLSKQLDKRRIGNNFDEIRDYLRNEWKRSGKTQKYLKEAMNDLTPGGGRISHYFGVEQAQVPNWEDWLVLKKELGLDNRYDELLIEHEREVVGKKISGGADAWNNGLKNKEGEQKYTGQSEWDITTPATPAAKQWDGWYYGLQSLKPALEPICMAQKPPEGRVTDNVLKWGTGGLNIDGCRVGTNGARFNGRNVDSDICGKYGTSKPKEDYNKGRFPANVIHDGSEEVLDEFAKAGERTSGMMNPKQQRKASKGKGGYHGNFPDTATESGTYGDSGTAARFFYCAKASKAERGEGNNHPTVKPIKLMEYLIKLVTPPEGTILDPFVGSGTTLLAAEMLGRNSIGIEDDLEYVKLIDKRMSNMQVNIFNFFTP